ncbi:UDP-glucose 6-dehydrogenase, partial [Acinetobacter baumannii]
FINAMSRLAESAGANISDIAKGIGLDNRIGPQFLQAGLGWGGSCLPKDVRGLITTGEKLGYRFGLLEEVEEINRTQSLHFVDRIRKRLGG